MRIVCAILAVMNELWYNLWFFAKLYDCKRMMKNVWYESAF